MTTWTLTVEFGLGGVQMTRIVTLLRGIDALYRWTVSLDKSEFDQLVTLTYPQYVWPAITDFPDPLSSEQQLQVVSMRFGSQLSLTATSDDGEKLREHLEALIEEYRKARQGHKPDTPEEASSQRQQAAAFVLEAVEHNLHQVAPERRLLLRRHYFQTSIPILWALDDAADRLETKVTEVQQK